MSKRLFPSIGAVYSFNKTQRAYLRELLTLKLIELACEITDISRDEEETVQAILKKLREQ